mgnify:CR=1 FL=1
MSARTRTPADARMPLGIAPRTLFVTGKGGVGKTTIAAAMATAWRDAGVRTLLVGLEGHANAARLLSDKPVGYDPVALSPGLWAMSIDLDNALREYARLRLKVKMLADRLVGSQVIEQFTQAAPGFSELLVMGKLWWLSQLVDARKRRRYEAIVVDAPATGHGLGLLNMAGVVARMFPVGPIAAEARAIDDFVRDESESSVLLVTLPEEIPVNETLELRDRLIDHGIHVSEIVVNGVLPNRIRAVDADAVAAARTATDDPAMLAALDTALYEYQRSSAQETELDRLITATGPVHTLPLRFADTLDRADISEMAAHLSGARRRARTSTAGAS